MGYKKLILKSDQEPSIIALRNAVTNESNIEIIPEEVPIGESQSNGEVEGVIVDNLCTFSLGRIRYLQSIFPWDEDEPR